MLVGLGWFDQVKGEAQSTGNFFYLLVFLYSQHLANGLSWNGYSIFEWGRMKEVGQIDERGPTILALICIIFSYPVITPPPPRIGVKITWKYDLGIISVVKCPEQCSVVEADRTRPWPQRVPHLDGGELQKRSGRWSEGIITPFLLRKRASKGSNKAKKQKKWVRIKVGLTSIKLVGWKWKKEYERRWKGDTQS